MYSTEHILYIICSLIFVGLTLFGAHFIKSKKYKNLFLFFWAFLCFFIHVSTTYVTFFLSDTGVGKIYDNQLFPIYFCNYMMYLLLIVSLWPNKKSKFFLNMATFVAWGGVFGALITLFVTPPGFSSWFNLQSAFSHTCLLMGCLWLFVGGYVKLNVYNLFPYANGLLSCGVVGGIVELIFYLGGKPSPNAMYLTHGPIELPEFKWWMFALAMSAIIFIFTMIWEFFTRKKEERWYKTNKDLFIYLPIIKKKKSCKDEHIAQNNSDLVENDR